MSLKIELENGLKDALRKNDDVRKRTIRMAMATAKLLEVEKRKPLDDNGMLAVLHKELKSREETIAEAKRGGREDLVEANQAEIQVLRSFLPQPFSPDELEILVRQAITETGASTMADMGKVMKVLTPRLEGRATGGEASNLVRKLLSAS
jgi:uncharacterized protein YqeY